jgi:hypothetical protein
VVIGLVLTPDDFPKKSRKEPQKRAMPAPTFEQSRRLYGARGPIEDSFSHR